MFIKATNTRIRIFLNSQIFLCGFKNFHLHGQRIDNKFAQFLGGVYMTPGRLSPRSEFTPVPSHGSIFVYMIPPQNVMSPRREFTPVLVPGREFHSGMKSRSGIM